MRLREPHVRKHIHTWTRTRKYGREVERKCSDCNHTQHTEVGSQDMVPDSLLHLAVADWKDGPLS